MISRQQTASLPTRILQELLDRGKVSARVLGRIPGLNVPGLSIALRALRAKGLILFEKPRARVCLNPDLGCIAGIDLGSSHLHFALADFSGKIRTDSTEKIRPEDGPGRLIAQIKAGVKKLSASHPKLGRLRGLAVGVPSPVNPRTGLVSFANNLPGWKNIDLGRELKRAFHVPVLVENDANAAALGERWRGVARGKDTFLFIALGTGIGSGVFIDGRLHRGRTGNAGELFRMNVDWQRWNEDFGDTGFFEYYASGMGITVAARELGVSPAALKPKGLADERDARYVFEAFRRGDPKSRVVLEDFYTILGAGIANITSVLDPDLIVLGGGIANGAPKFMLTRVESVVRSILKDLPPIRLSMLGDKAQTCGAVYCALQGAFQALR